MTLNGGTQKATRILRRLVDATDGNEMRLSDVATIKTHYPEADFWLVRRGSLKTCGQPSREYNPEHIGIKVTRTDILLPDYLYYCMMWLHQSKRWEALATGTLSLVNIKVSDVRTIELSPR